MSPNDDNPEEVKKVQKKYLWFGYGNHGLSDPMNPHNIRSDSSIPDKLFKMFGVRENRN